MLAVAQERQRRVTPLGRGAVLAGQDAAIDHDAAADAGSQRRAEHDVGPGTVEVGRRRRGSVDRLGQDEALAVVGETDRPPQRRGEIAVQSPTVERLEVGVQDHPPARVQHPRRSDPNRAAPARVGLHPRDHAADGAQHLVVRGRRPFPVARQLSSVVAERQPLDLRAADVDADSHAATIAYFEDL